METLRPHLNRFGFSQEEIDALATNREADENITYLQEQESRLVDFSLNELHARTLEDIHDAQEKLSKLVEFVKTYHENTLNELDDFPANIQVPERARDGVAELRDTVESGIDIVKYTENKPFLRTILKGFFWIGSLFGFENPFDLKDEIVEATNTIADDTEIRNEVGETLQDAPEIPERLRTHPALQAKLNKLLQDPNIISAEELAAINEAAAGGEIDLLTIKGAISAETYENIISSILNDPEMAQIIQEIIISEVSESVMEAYPYINLRPESREQLQIILREHLGNNSAKELATNFLNGKPIGFGEMITSAPEYSIDAAKLMISLLASGVISISDIALDIGDDVINFTLTGIGLVIPGISIPVNEFTEKLEGMNNTERGVFLAIMYRQSGPFVRLVSNIMGGVTRTIIDGLNVNSLDSDKWSLAFGNADQKLQNFTKISKAVLGTDGENIGEAIKTGIQTLQKNYEILSIMESGENIGDLTAKLNSLDPSIIGNNSPIDIDDLRNIVQQKVLIPNAEVFKFSRYLQGFYPGLTQAEDTLTKSMQNIAEYQRARVGKSALAQIWNYPAGVIEELRIAQRGERLVFEGLDQAGALNKMQQLKKLSLEFPDLFRHTLGVFPEIVFLGLDITMRDDETNFMEAMQESLMYMTGIIGPIKLIFSGGAQLVEGELQWYNFAAAGAGTALLAMDTISAGKIIRQGGGTTYVTGRIGKEIVLRPITNLINAGINIGKFGRGIGRLATGTGSINWTQVGRNISNLKLPKRGKLAAIAAGVAGLYYVGDQLLSPDISDEYQAMIDEGVIDTEGNVVDAEGIQSMIADLSRREKTALSEIIIASSLEGIIPVAENLDISIDNDTVVVSAKNSLTGEWAISHEVKNYFSQLGLETRFEAYVA